MLWPGEQHAWDLLSERVPDEVKRNAQAGFNQDTSTYELTCFDHQITVSVPDRTISGVSDTANIIINDLGKFSRLSILNYLVNARNISLSGQLVRPTDLSGGDLFARGTHTLPLDGTAELFNNCQKNFFTKGGKLGGAKLEYGDMSLRLFPFPRVPVILIVWSGDDEFPPKSSLLFDSSCTFHLPVDVLWSTAMMTLQLMMRL
jgi:hypothetical protein